MANCISCGKSVAFWTTKCIDCGQAEQRAVEEKRAKAKAEMSREARKELDTLREQAIEVKAFELSSRINRGEAVQLFDRVYLGVDSMIEGRSPSFDFDISPLIRMGYEGWAVTGVVPRTAGLALTNVRYGTTG